MSSKRLEILNGFVSLVDVILLVLIYSHLHSVSNFEIITIFMDD